jgi:hypothetical protein
MRVIAVLVLTGMLLISCNAAAQRRPGQQDAERNHIVETGKALPELRQKVREQGLTPVIVDLNLLIKPEAKLSPQEQQLQRRAIAEMQSRLLSELAGTKYDSPTLATTVPAIGLRVGPDALAALERSTLVKKIAPDRPIKSDLELKEQK